MNKSEQYFKEIQKLAKSSSNCFYFIEKMNNFINTQNILKRNKISKTEDMVKIYFIEYVNNKLEEDFHNQSGQSNLYLFLYYKINSVCLSLKTVCTDDIVQAVFLNKTEKINEITIVDYSKKKSEVVKLEKRIDELKKGWI